MNTATFVKYLMPSSRYLLATLTMSDDTVIDIYNIKTILTKDNIINTINGVGYSIEDIRKVYITKYCTVVDDDCFFEQNTGSENRFRYVIDLEFDFG